MSNQTTRSARPGDAKPSALSRRMTPDEFKAEVKSKGWTYKSLAERWQMTANWVSKQARNADRGQHWDDAVRGLPFLITRPKKQQ